MIGRALTGSGHILRKRIALALGAIIVAGPVLAEPPTGSRLGGRSIAGLKRTEEQADHAGTQLANCMVAKREGSARDYVSATTPEDADKAQRLLFKDISCMSLVNLSVMSDTSAFSVPRDILRGKLAEAFLKSEKVRVAALPALPLGKDYQRPWFAATGRDAVIDEMGSCVADTNPKGIAALLATVSYGKDENVAFNAVVPTLGICLRAGAKMQANRQALRAALADALYQRVTRPAPAAQAAAAEAAARRTRLAFKGFTECVAKKRPQEAQSYIIEQMNEQETTRLRNKMLDDACWRASTGSNDPIVTTGLKLQGSLAEALMAAEIDSRPLGEAKTIAPLKHQPVTEEDRRKNDPDTVKFMETMAILFRWGECVVRADVAGSRALLKSEPASPEETAALAALKPAFGACLGQGQSLAGGTAELRAAVASNYYRLTKAPRTVETTAGVTQ